MFYVFLCLILIAAILISLFFSAVEIWTFFWKALPLSINHAEVQEVEVQNKKRYRPMIRYTYTFNGKPYISERWSLFGSRLFNTISEAEKAIHSDYIWVCPLSPSIAFVYREKRLLPGLLISLIISIVLLMTVCE